VCKAVWIIEFNITDFLKYNDTIAIRFWKFVKANRPSNANLNRAISRCVTALRVRSPVADSPPSSSGRTTTACTRIPRVLFRTSNYSNVTSAPARSRKREKNRAIEKARRRHVVNLIGRGRNKSRIRIFACRLDSGWKMTRDYLVSRISLLLRLNFSPSNCTAEIMTRVIALSNESERTRVWEF